MLGIHLEPLKIRSTLSWKRITIIRTWKPVKQSNFFCGFYLSPTNNVATFLKNNWQRWCNRAATSWYIRKGYNLLLYQQLSVFLKISGESIAWFHPWNWLQACGEEQLFEDTHVKIALAYLEQNCCSFLDKGFIAKLVKAWKFLKNPGAV